MATVTVQQVSLAGITPTANAASGGGGDKFAPGDNVMLEIINGSGSDVTATVVTQNTSIGGLAVADLTCTVAGGARGMFGPFPRDYFAAAADGLAVVTWSATSSITFYAVKI